MIDNLNIIFTLKQASKYSCGNKIMDRKDAGNNSRPSCSKAD